MSQDCSRLLLNHSSLCLCFSFKTFPRIRNLQNDTDDTVRNYSCIFYPRSHKLFPKNHVLLYGSMHILKDTFLEAQFEGQALRGTQINVGGVSGGIHFHVLMA